MVLLQQPRRVRSEPCLKPPLVRPIAKLTSPLGDAAVIGGCDPVIVCFSISDSRELYLKFARCAGVGRLANSKVVIQLSAKGSTVVSDHNDVIVVGGGPGGTSVAQRLAATGKRILIRSSSETATCWLYSGVRGIERHSYLFSKGG